MPQKPQDKTKTDHHHIRRKSKKEKKQREEIKGGEKTPFPFSPFLTLSLSLQQKSKKMRRVFTHHKKRKKATFLLQRWKNEQKTREGVDFGPLLLLFCFYGSLGSPPPAPLLLLWCFAGNRTHTSGGGVRGGRRKIISTLSFLVQPVTPKRKPCKKEGQNDKKFGGIARRT